MAWIQVDATLPNHAKVFALADILKDSSHEVVGRLISLWIWMLNNREDGDFTRLDFPMIAATMGYKGKADKLIHALETVRLIDRIPTGYHIHDWEEHVSMLLIRREENRKKTKERVQRFRRKNQESNELMKGEECNALQERYVTENVTPCNALTVPKPYLTVPKDDDEEDDDHRARACARDSSAEIDLLLSEDEKVRRSIKVSYRKAFGREPNPSEIDRLSRIAMASDRGSLMDEALAKAAANGAKSIPPYVDQIISDWEYYNIHTLEDIAEYEFLREEARRDPAALDKLDTLRRAKKVSP